MTVGICSHTSSGSVAPFCSGIAIDKFRARRNGGFEVIGELGQA